MTTFYKRSIRRRISSFCEDCMWKIQTYGKYIVGGFMLGALSMVIVAEIVWKI